ncbi:MAG: PilZ domain-containing protein [Desulfobacterales bacterium]|nr:PilZ domain-containing protein [Desulfobacterales bacterium]MDD4071795.1 PilZ domain-containing protein [Desulfobacterales bacterium]MDD4393407.1 PilZ domain-containing protein [Desulfobacterales bacterium]
MKNNQRKRPRYPVKIDGMVITPEASIPILATEISVDGIRIQSSKPISSGTNISISLQFEEEIWLYGTVIWALDSGSESQRIYQIGIETYAIGIPEIKAISFPEKAELFEEILSRLQKMGQQEKNSSLQEGL